MGRRASQPVSGVQSRAYAPAYHGELGLQLDLQALQRASQVGDLAPAGLQLLGVGADLLAELPALQDAGEAKGRALSTWPGYHGRPALPSLSAATFSKNQASASLRFCSATASYCALIAFSSLVRSTPGAASISTLTSPGPSARKLWSSCGSREEGCGSGVT